MYKYYIILLILGSIKLCEVNNKSDKIRPKHPVQNEKCKSESKGSFQRFGYQISNYYIISSILSYDLNDDGISDSIAVLTPLELTPRHPSCKRKNVELVEDRLLLINLMEKDGSIAEKHLYDKVISNGKSWAVKQGSEYIRLSDGYSGIVLWQDYGQACYGKYFIYVRHHEEHDFVVDSLVYKTRCPRDTKEIVRRQKFPKSPLPLEEYSRDYLLPFKKKHGIIK